MLKLNFNKLSVNLEKYKKSHKESPTDSGLAQVLRYVWNHSPTFLVDFDSFSYEDVIDAMESLAEIPTSEDEIYHDPDHSDFVMSSGNPWLHNALSENACSNLFHTKNKHYEYDDDFL